MKDFIKELFKDVIVNDTYEEHLIEKYFSKNYVQIVDGQRLDFEGFKKHIQKLKTVVQEVKVQFLNMAVDEASVFTKHLVESTLKDGSSVKHKVFAEFRIEKGKVIQCDELTLQLKGNPTESNLGSII